MLYRLMEERRHPAVLCCAAKPPWLMRRYLLTPSVICPYVHSTTTGILPAETRQMFTKTRLNEKIWKAWMARGYHRRLLLWIHNSRRKCWPGLFSARQIIGRTCFGLWKVTLGCWADEINIPLCVKCVFICIHRSSSSFTLYHPYLTFAVVQDAQSQTKMDLWKHCLLSNFTFNSTDYTLMS